MRNHTFLLFPTTSQMTAGPILLQNNEESSDFRFMFHLQKMHNVKTKFFLSMGVIWF